MIRIPAKPSPLNCRSESFDGRYRFPGCRDAEDKFNICILPSISQFAFQLLLNRLVQKSEEIAISAKAVRMMSIQQCDTHLQALNFLNWLRIHILVLRVSSNLEEPILVQKGLEPLLIFFVITHLLRGGFWKEAPWRWCSGILGIHKDSWNLENLVSTHVDRKLFSSRGIGTRVTVKYLIFHSARSPRPFLQPTNIFLSSCDVAECDASTYVKDEWRTKNDELDHTCHAKIDGNDQFWPWNITGHDGTSRKAENRRSRSEGFKKLM